MPIGSGFPRQASTSRGGTIRTTAPLPHAASLAWPACRCHSRSCHTRKECHRNTSRTHSPCRGDRRRTCLRRRSSPTIKTRQKILLPLSLLGVQQHRPSIRPEAPMAVSGSASGPPQVALDCRKPRPSTASGRWSRWAWPPVQGEAGSTPPPHHDRSGRAFPNSSATQVAHRWATGESQAVGLRRSSSAEGVRQARQGMHVHPRGFCRAWRKTLCVHGTRQRSSRGVLKKVPENTQSLKAESVAERAVG